MGVNLLLVLVLLGVITDEISAVALGGACTADGECTDTNTVCTDTNGDNTADTCKCGTDYKDDGSGTCVLDKKLGETCSNVKECPANAVCDTDCACQSDYKQENGNCVLKGLDDACSATSDCAAVTNSECDSGTKKCTCLSTHKVQGEACVVKGLDDACSATSDCAAVTNSECDSGTKKCTCRSTHKVQGEACVVKVGLGDACSATSDCMDVSNSECDTSTSKCTCPGTHKVQGEACVVKAVSDVTCTTDGADCDGIENAECDTTATPLVCKCNVGYIENSNRCQAENGATSTTTMIGLLFLPMVILLMEKLLK